MSETDKEKLQAFARKMQDEGADGFADGPRPWEQWDESGSRVWEGRARRVPVKQRPARNIGDRLLSAMATIALATLIIGIGGVYFSEYPAQQVAQTGIQPPPIVLTPIRRFPPEQQHASLTGPAPAPAIDIPDNFEKNVPLPEAAATVIIQTELPATDTTTIEDNSETPDLALAFTGTDPVAPDQAIPVTNTSPVEPAPGTVDDIADPQQVIPDKTEIPIIVLQTIIPVTRPRQDQVAAETVAVEDATEIQEVATIETGAQTTAPIQVTTAAEEHIEALNKLEPPAAKPGNWVVNLASYTWKSTANKKVEEFRGKGIDAELVTVTINDKPMHRVRVTGFGSSRLAKEQISSLEEQLGLEGAWISRR